MNILWSKIKSVWQKPPGKTIETTLRQKSEIGEGKHLIRPETLLARLREYLFLSGEPDSYLNPRWLAAKLEIDERILLDALAYAVSDGLVELHWEVFCPACGARPEEYHSLAESRPHIDCPACGSDFDVHLDRDVRVTFSVTEQIRRERRDETLTAAPVEAGEHSPTRGLDLLLAPNFRKLFSGETPSPNESLKILRVAVLFTDLRGSTAIYAERGDPQAYQMVREHFEILMTVIERNRGVIIKTIGDSVMASFASGADAVVSAFEAQTELRRRAAQIGGELILKAGVHSGACLAVNLNGRLDFFGGAVNIAARVQGLSLGNDVIITEPVFDELESARLPYQTIESFDSHLRGLSHATRVHRLAAKNAAPTANR